MTLLPLVQGHFPGENIASICPINDQIPSLKILFSGSDDCKKLMNENNYELKVSCDE